MKKWRKAGNKVEAEVEVEAEGDPSGMNPH